jgi:3'-phosphoadenosine 5'-phosphosulfate sulfotransferase (PAPS reductase)/FAD synthetase
MQFKMKLSNQRLTHLKKLEAESIHIMREIVLEFENPSMLYSLGKDSSVMFHLAEKPSTLHHHHFLEHTLIPLGNSKK